MLVEPGDAVHGSGGPPDGATVLEFWCWAFSNLCDDDIKGWFAEWLVGLLLGLPLRPRISWANSDHITPEGVRIEVKASAYWQSWKLVDEGGTAKLVESIPVGKEPAIYFGGLRASDSVLPMTGPSQPLYKSDLYIFAFQNERDPAQWSALDLTQWEFYALTRDQLATVGTKSIGLSRLRKLCSPMSAADLRVKGRAIVRELAACRQAGSHS